MPLCVNLRRELPPCDTQPEYLQELEAVMSLLTFSDPADSPVSHLIDGRRQQLASQVNSAILANQLQRKEPQLNDVLRHLIAAQTKAETTIRCPTIDGL